MNKFKLLAIALVLGTASLFANDTNPSVSKDEIRKQIIELVETSEHTLSTQATVNVTFTFSTEGEIVILKVDSRDQEVLEFIRKNINSKKLDKPASANKYFTMPIVIK